MHIVDYVVYPAGSFASRQCTSGTVSATLAWHKSFKIGLMGVLQLSAAAQLAKQTQN